MSRTKAPPMMARMAVPVCAAVERVPKGGAAVSLPDGVVYSPTMRQSSP